MSGSVPAVGGVLAVLVPVLLQGAIGLIVGALVLLVVTGVKKLLPKKRS
jgi:predicted DNA repair protein MutK